MNTYTNLDEIPPNGDILSELLHEDDDTDLTGLWQDPATTVVGNPTRATNLPSSQIEVTIRSPSFDIEAQDPFGQNTPSLITQNEMPVGRKARRRAQLASSSRRVRLRKKIKITNLRMEEVSLSEQLEALVARSQNLHATRRSSLYEEAVSAENCKRQLAEKENQQLRQALYQQSSYMRSVTAVVPSTVGYHTGLNMSRFLHTTTHLPANSRSRLRYLESVCTEAKLDLATQILLNETDSTVPFTTPNFSWELLEVGPSGFGVTSFAVFALDTPNLCKAFQAASTAIINCAVVWPNYSLLGSNVKQVDIQSAKLKVRYGVSENRFQSGISGEQVLLESRDISYCRVAGEGSIFLWDFVDEDDQFPLKKDTAVKRSTVGALLVRPECCDDGVERVICRYICSKTHLVNSSELPPDIERFSRSKKLCAQVADSMEYETIKGDVAQAFGVI